jgi:monoterpene epsilon-lactone hydrolase
VASPERQTIVDMLRMMPRGVVTRENVHLLREQLDAIAGQLPRDTVMEPAEGLGIPADWVRCGEVDTTRRLLYLHGGAYISGSRKSHGPLAARISRAPGVSVLLLDYRLAPEHPHPAAVEDAVAALAWMGAHNPSSDVSPAAQTFIAGDSAGGGLTLATLLAVRDAGTRMPDAAVTLSAWTDLAMTGDSIKTRAAVDPMIDVPSMHPAASLYLGKTDARGSLASPLYGALAGLPPLLMQVGDDEVLLDDTLRFADRARQAGTLVTVEVWPEMFHVFQGFAGMLPEGRDAIKKIGAFLRSQSPNRE